MSKNPTLYSWLVLILLSVIWGSSFILIKRGLVSFSPNEVAALRIFISFIAVLPMSFYLKRVPFRNWFAIFMVGLLGSGIPPFFFSLAQTVVDSMVAGILNSVTSLFTLLVGIVLFRQRPLPLKVIGVLIGLSGAATLIYMQSGRSTVQSTYSLYILLATLCYGTSVNILKRWLQDVDSLSITVMAFMMIGPPAGLFLFMGTGFMDTMATDPHAPWSLMYVSLLAVFGTAAATALFFKLVQMTNPLFGATVTFLIPIVAVIWGWIDGEYLDAGVVVGMLLILAGVYLTNRPVNRN